MNLGVWYRLRQDDRAKAPDDRLIEESRAGLGHLFSHNCGDVSTLDNKQLVIKVSWLKAAQSLLNP